MANGGGALIGLLGTVVLVGVSFKAIEQIDVQGKKIINPTKMKLPRLGL